MDYRNQQQSNHLINQNSFMEDSFDRFNNPLTNNYVNQQSINQMSHQQLTPQYQQSLATLQSQQQQTINKSLQNQYLQINEYDDDQVDDNYQPSYQIQYQDNQIIDTEGTEVLQKEKELREINEMRIKTLEKIIKEKVQVISNLESEVDRQYKQSKNLEKLVDEREQVLGDYESKFDRVKIILQDKDMENSNIKAQLANFYDSYMNEKETARKFNDRIEVLQDQLRAQELSFKDKLDEITKAKDTESEREIRLLKQKLKEKEKRIESTKINADERLNIALESRDKEIKLLQEQLSLTYQQQQSEIEKLNQQLQVMNSELQNKDKAIDGVQKQSYNQSQMLQQHIEKLKEILNQKTDIINNMEDSNRQQLDLINQLKHQIAQLEIKLTNQMHQSQFEREQILHDSQLDKQDMEQKFNHREQDLQRHIKDQEKEKKKIIRQFEQLKDQLREKERGVKSEIEKVWNDWEERCGELESDKKNLEFRLEEIDSKNREYNKQLAQMKKEMKNHKIMIDEKDQELKILQSKYEQELSSRDNLIEENEQKAKKNQEYLDYEIQHLKKELEKQYKKEYFDRQQNPQQNNFQRSSNRFMGSDYKEQLQPISMTDIKHHNDKNNMQSDLQSFRLALNPIQSNRHSIENNANNPNNFQQQQLQNLQNGFNTLKQTSLNDSLDNMRKEFYNQFNNLLGESVGFGASGEKLQNQMTMSPLSYNNINRLSRQGAQTNAMNNPISTIIQNKEKDLMIKELQLENEELKAIVEQMKVDMEMVVMEIKQGRIQGANKNNSQANPSANILIQQEIIQKERRIFELERKLKHKDDELDKLKAERERLLQISSELRAELNTAQKLLQERENQSQSADYSQDYQPHLVNIDILPDSARNNPNSQRLPGFTNHQDILFPSNFHQNKGYQGSGGRETADFYRRNSSAVEFDNGPGNVYIKHQQLKIDKLDNYVEQLAVQMKQWIQSGINQSTSRTRNGASEERKVGGGGRVGPVMSLLTSERNIRDRSMSPNSKMRKQGEDFLKRIEDLRQNLQLEGQSLQIMQQEVYQEKKNLLQSERQTPSQKRASDKVKKALDKKRQEETKPKVRNYALKESQSERRQSRNKSKGTQDGYSEFERDTGDFRGGETQPVVSRALTNNFNHDNDVDLNDNENSNINMPRIVKSGVGNHSNLRRKQSEGGAVKRRSPSKKIGDEIII
eukprot:403333356